MLVSLEGYDDNSIEGWSIKKAVKAVAAPVKVIAKPIVKASPTVKKITASAKKITAPVSKITKASGTKITQATGIKKIINAVPALATPVNIVKSIKTKSLTPLKTQAKDPVKMVGIAQKVATRPFQKYNQIRIFGR
jgi:peroxiredoxin